MKNFITLIFFVLYWSFSALSQAVTFHSQCSDIKEENIICDHSILQNFSLTMNEEFSNQGPNNECDGSNEHDRSWIAFKAPEGDYFMRVSLTGCTNPFSSIKGAQVTVYGDCNYEHIIYCSNLCTQGTRDLPEGLFVPGEIYYLLVDGCFGSVCDINIRFIGSDLKSNCLTGSYVPMDTITDWHYLVADLGGWGKFWHYDKGDTLINGKKYRIIGTYPEPDFPWNRFIREDRSERKVYEYYNGDDHILYDFSLELGDILTYDSGTSVEVINMDTVESVYGPLRRWQMDGPGPSFFVIEGLGADYLFFPVGISDPVYSLLSAYNTCERIYGNDSIQPPRWLSSEDTLLMSICEGESIDFNGAELTENGIYRDTLSNVLGCDSIVLLDLSVINKTNSTHFLSICSNDYYVFEDDTLSVSGTYQTILTSYQGCDSIITLDLNVLETSMTHISESICPHEYYVLGTDTLIDSGSYELMLVSEMGCDSIVSLDLTVLEEENPDCISVIKEGQWSELSLFPSPVRDELKVSYNNVINKMKIYNCSGDLVYQQDLYSKNTVINLSVLNSGIYFVYFESDRSFSIKKIVKE